MKMYISRVLVLLMIVGMMIAILPGCNTEDNNIIDVSKIETESGYIRMEFSEATGYKFEGMGTELDPHLLRSINTNYGTTEEDWEMICERIRAMKLQKIRVMVMPEWYEPKNENDDPHNLDMSAFSWDNEDMRSLYKVLDIAQEEGIRVNLTLWGAHASKQSWLAIPGCVHWVSPPNDLDEWSENFSALLKYVIQEKGYTCVQEITPYNEPNPAYYVKDTSEVNIEDYAEMVVNLDARLKTEGIRDLVDLNIGDDGGVPSWLLENVTHEELKEVGDSFNSHVYRSVYYNLRELTDLAQTLSGMVKENTDKPFKVNEFGAKFQFDDNSYGEALDSFERGMLIGKMATTFMGEGCVAMCHWCLFDQYYGQGAFMYRGLWAFKDKNWEIRPAYYAITMITQHTYPGSDMYKGITTDVQIAGTALESKNGWTYLLVNESPLPKKVAIINGNIAAGTYNIYAYTEDRVPSDGSLTLTSSGTVELKENVIYYEIPANSFIVLSDI